MKKHYSLAYQLIIAFQLLIQFNALSQEKNAITPTGNFYALIIGESLYDNPKLLLDRPAKDAQKFKDVICSKYSFDEKNVKMLLNPSRQQILTEVFNLRKIVTSNDNLLLFYAGHGYWDDAASQGYWWPKDAAIDEPSNWLSNSDLKEQIRGIKSAHTLLISDACFSGGIFRTRSAADAIKTSSFNIQMLYKMPSRSAMTSGTLTTVPDESVFFSYLMKRLNDNTERFLPSQELFNSLKQAVINNSMTVPQDGVIADAGDEGGDFIFILKDTKSYAESITPSPSLTNNTTKRGLPGGSADDLIESGKENFNNKKFEAAIDDFTKAITLEPQNPEPYVGRGRANFNFRKLNPALADFDKAIELSPTSSWAYCLRGTVKVELRRKKEAFIDYSKAIELNPRYTYAYNFRGQLLTEERKFDQAIANFSTAIKLDAKFASAYDNRGEAKLRSDKAEDARLDFTKAIELNPKYVPAYCNRALAEIKLGKLEDADADIDKALEIEPRFARAYNSRGLLEMKRSKTDQAIADFSKCLELNPRLADAYFNRARAYVLKQDYNKALDDVNNVLEQMPNNKEALSLKAEIQKHK